MSLAFQITATLLIIAVYVACLVYALYRM